MCILVGPDQQGVSSGMVSGVIEIFYILKIIYKEGMR